MLVNTGGLRWIREISFGETMAMGGRRIERKIFQWSEKQSSETKALK